MNPSSQSAALCRVCPRRSQIEDRQVRQAMRVRASTIADSSSRHSSSTSSRLRQFSTDNRSTCNRCNRSSSSASSFSFSSSTKISSAPKNQSKTKSNFSAARSMPSEKRTKTLSTLAFQELRSDADSSSLQSARISRLFCCSSIQHYLSRPSACPESGGKKSSRALMTTATSSRTSLSPTTLNIYSSRKPFPGLSRFHSAAKKACA